MFVGTELGKDDQHQGIVAGSSNVLGVLEHMTSLP